MADQGLQRSSQHGETSNRLCRKVPRVTLERSALATGTVRDATFDVLRRLDLTTIFSNPGSTEVPFPAGLPPDLTFVLALHEGSVVAMAAGVPGAIVGAYHAAVTGRGPAL